MIFLIQNQGLYSFRKTKQKGKSFKDKTKLKQFTIGLTLV